MADRPTASTVTDDQLEALYAELDRYVLLEIDRTDGEECPRLAQHGVLHGLAGVARRRTEQRDRARDVAVQLENENARLENELRTARDGTADREALLTEARDALEAANAGGHSDDWPHLAPGIRALHARAERAEQQLAAVRRIPRLPHHSQQDGELGRAYTRGWQSVVTCIDEALAGHPVDPTATAYPEDAALDGAQQPAPTDQCHTVDVDGTPVHVRGTGGWTDEDAHHFADVVRAAKRRFEAEQRPNTEGDR